MSDQRQRDEKQAKTAEAMMAVAAKGLLLWDRVLTAALSVPRVEGEAPQRPPISAKDIALLASAATKLAQVGSAADDAEIARRRAALRAGIENPIVREAMRVANAELERIENGGGDESLQ